MPLLQTGWAGIILSQYGSVICGIAASNQHWIFLSQQQDRRQPMAHGTLDIMKLDGRPTTYQIMFEENSGGTFVARVTDQELLPFLHGEMRVDIPVAENAVQLARIEERVRLGGVSLDENDLHAVMDYMEAEV